ncbi:MAG: hypothetical protein AAF599_18525, partial [Bacteroidota bacterium]
GAEASGSASVAMGDETIASGFISTAIGKSAKASGSASVAIGDETTASGFVSTALGSLTTASGSISTAFGNATKALGGVSSAFGNSTTAISYAETAMGTYNTAYIPNDSFSYDAADRLFVLGNGRGRNELSDALVIYKNGNMEINGAVTIDNAYTLPTTDGTTGQFLQTDGSGNINWTNGTPDNLGNHTATQNIELSNNWLSGDGNNEGLQIDNNGTIKISNAIEASGGTMLFDATNQSGTPSFDGFRLRLQNDYFNANEEAYIFEKTDGNGNTPDGAIVFANTGSDGVVEESLVIRGDGDIGIGTVDPKARLDVEGEILFSTATLQMGLTSELESTTPTMNLSLNALTPNVDQNTIGGAFRIDSRNTNDAPLFQWIVKPTGTSSVADDDIKMVLNTSGQLGIGTTTPAALLDLSDGSGANDVLLRFNTERPWRFEERGAGANSTLELQSSASGKNFEVISSDGTVIASFRGDGGGGNNVGINKTIGTNDNALEVNGNASKSSAGDWLANSDARLKKN